MTNEKNSYRPNETKLSWAETWRITPRANKIVLALVGVASIAAVVNVANMPKSQTAPVVPVASNVDIASIQVKQSFNYSAKPVTKQGEAGVETDDSKLSDEDLSKYRVNRAGVLFIKDGKATLHVNNKSSFLGVDFISLDLDYINAKNKVNLKNECPYNGCVVFTQGLLDKGAMRAELVVVLEDKTKEYQESISEEQPSGDKTANLSPEGFLLAHQGIVGRSVRVYGRLTLQSGRLTMVSEPENDSLGSVTLSLDYNGLPSAQVKHLMNYCLKPGCTGLVSGVVESGLNTKDLSLKYIAFD